MRSLTAYVVVLFLSSGALAASSNLVSSIAQDITLVDSAGDPIPPGYVEVFEDSGSVYVLNWRATETDDFWQEIAHELTLHHGDGSFIQTLASDTITAYKSFVRKHGDAVYYGLGNDIHSVSYTSPGAPTLAATLGNNFDMQFDSDGTAFAVANPTWMQNNLYKVDLSGGNNHVLVVQDAGVYSAELALDAADNLYYGTYGAAGEQIVTFTEAHLDGVTDTPLAMSDGVKLTDLEYGAGGIEIDEADNVVFSLNSGAPDYNALCVIQSGKDYSGYGSYRYDVLCAMNYWTTNVDAVGDVFGYAGVTDNAAFTSSGWVFSMVPEPVTLMLLAAGGVLLLRRGRYGRERMTKPRNHPLQMKGTQR